MEEWIKIEEAATILGLSISGTYYRKSIGLLETRMVRQGSFQWLLFRRSQCEEHSRNPPSYFRSAVDLPEKMSRWTEVELAQLATFIDCEGCLLIHCQRSNRPDRSDVHVLRVFVANTCLPAIEMLHDRFGGSIQTHLRSLKNPQWRDHHRWYVGSYSALLLLELARPYFIIKRDQVALAIAFQRHVEAYICGWRDLHIHPEEVAWREAQKQQMHVLNRRGAAP